MIRGIDDKGCVIIGLTRREIEGLLAGKRCCINSVEPTAPGPHICIYFGETNADAIAALKESFQGRVPEAVDYRTKPSTEDN